MRGRRLPDPLHTASITWPWTRQDRHSQPALIGPQFLWRFHLIGLSGVNTSSRTTPLKNDNQWPLTFAGLSANQARGSEVRRRPRSASGTFSARCLSAPPPCFYAAGRRILQRGRRVKTVNGKADQLKRSNRVRSRDHPPVAF